ncbi:MAG: hypothetical protein H6Q91_1797 [Deltaproteobacteria bacterium]|nr:hypothetical protein [Deltaproteobacteria bacterium]
MRVAAVVVASLLAASPAAAYSISAQSLGFQDSNSLGTVESGNVVGDASGNLIDGHARTSGESGGLEGYMLVHIVDYFAAQNSIAIDFLGEKTWTSSILERFDDFVLDPGATELVLRVHVTSTDESDLAIAPSQGFDNGYARAHVRARVTFHNMNPHVVGDIDGLAAADRSLPLEWTTSGLDGVSPAGYGSTSAGPGFGTAEIRIPASEVDGDDYLLVSGKLYGEVRGGHWNGAFAKSQLSGGSMSFEIVGGDGVPLNPIFLSVPEPDGSLLGEVAMAGVGFLAYSRSQAKVARRRRKEADSVARRAASRRRAKFIG